MNVYVIDSSNSYRLRKRERSYMDDLACGACTLRAVAIEFFAGDMAAAKRTIYGIEETRDDDTN